MKGIFCLIAAFCLFTAKAAIVDTVDIYSKSMHLSKKCVVILPFAVGQKPIPVPVVYLLHGYGGSYSNWIRRVPEIKTYADRYQVMIVCPDGDSSSWYLDSPVDPSMKYETYISTEVPEYIDEHYLTIRSRKARAITGLSMGGHGALFIGLRHSAYFGTCGSMSGLVDLSGSRNKYELVKRLGDTVHYASNWKNFSVMQLIEQMPKDSLAIIFDCGVDDFLYAFNKQLHEKMVQRKIAHDYTERPGSHDWQYWSNSIQYQLLFFRNYFDRK
jgi:S-formylglutathione hydrolase FrmB